MAITFDDEQEAIEYKKEKAQEGRKARITKVGNRYIVDLMGDMAYKDYTLARNEDKYPEGYLRIDREIEDTYNAETPTVRDINKLIKEKTQYGVKTVTAEKSGYVLSWNNDSADWYPSLKVKKGDDVRLDANQVLVYGINLAELKKIVDYGQLEQLPLYGGSFERMKMNTPDYSKGDIPPMIKQARAEGVELPESVEAELNRKAEQN